MENKLRVFASTPLRADHAELMTQLEPRIDLIYAPDLVGEPLRPADHYGRMAATDDPAAWQQYRALADQTEAHFGFLSPTELGRCVKANPQLRWVHATMAGAGALVRQAGLTDDELRRCLFTTSAGSHARPLAEWTLMAILESIKEVPQMRRDQAAKRWGPTRPMGMIHQLTVVVVGMGHIGREVGSLLGSLGARVIGVNRSKRLVNHVESVVGTERLTEVVAEAAVLVSALPDAVGTHGMISAEVFDHLKPNATFVSVGRGICVDQDALINALQSGRIRYAALDVTTPEPLPASSPLWQMDNVLIAPHTAAVTAEEDEWIVRFFAANATRFLNGQPLLNQVNTALWY